MVITRNQTQVQWESIDNKSVTSAIEVVSDAITLDQTCVSLSITLSAHNLGTPALGDTVVWSIQWSTGDEYDTSEHAQYLTTLDTYAENIPGEDPAIRTLQVDIVAQKFRLACVCAQAATRNISITARIEEQRAT